MKTYTIYQVDAFAEGAFKGNPAAVIIADEFPDDESMQNIAMENNLSETAFVCSLSDGYEIRWFTPGVEVDLCGHATLAAAYVLFAFYHPEKRVLTFHSPRSGRLMVEKMGDMFQLDFPADKVEPAVVGGFVFEALGAKPATVYKGKDDYLLLFDNERTIRNMNPDYRTLAKLKTRGIIVTAAGDEMDFVSRFFAPQAGIDEDPVTGSAHTLLTPFWSQRLHKKQLVAKQISKRGGVLQCEDCGERVKIAGNARLYLKGEIYM